MSVRPWELVHRGQVEAAALWFDVGLVGEAQAAGRIAALWGRGDQLHPWQGGWLLRFVRPRPVANGPGLVLVEREGVLVAAPLREPEWDQRGRGDLAVRGGELRAERPGSTIEPGELVIDDLERVEVRGLGRPPPPLRAAVRPVSVERGDFGVGERSSEAEALIAALEGRGTAPPPEPEPEPPPQGGGWFSSPNTPALLRGLGAVLDRWIGPAGEAPPEGMPMEEVPNHDQQLSSLLDRFQGDIEEALRHAIPLGSGGLSRSHPALRAPVRRRERLAPEIAPSSSGSGPSYNASASMYEALRERYREAAEALVDAGEIEKAAFVYADLLGDVPEALSLLEEHGMFELAARLAEVRRQPPARVARLWILAGDLRRAFRIARDEAVFGQLIEQFSGPEALRLRVAYGAELASQGRLIGAVNTVWAEASLRELALPWLRELVEGEEHRAWAVVRLYDLDSVRAQRVFDALCRDDSEIGVARRNQLVRAVAPVGPPQWLRPLARQVLGDAGSEDFDQQAFQLLMKRPELADLAADLPALPRHLGRQHRFHEVTGGGGPAVLDVAAVHGGMLCALGQGGLIRLDPHGRVDWRDSTPTTDLVADREGFRLIGVDRSGSHQRLHHIDLRALQVRPWSRVELDWFAPGHGYGQWVVVCDGLLTVIDLTEAHRDESAWQYVWQGPEVDVLAAVVHATGAEVAVRGDGVVEHWSFDLWWIRRSQRVLPEGTQVVALHLQGSCAAVGPNVHELLRGRQLQRQLSGPVLDVVRAAEATFVVHRSANGLTIVQTEHGGSSIDLLGARRWALRGGLTTEVVAADDLGRVLRFDPETRALQVYDAWF